ncbi:hypothetical protein M885DRAFT_520415 [Pelagophyceae sp. CCMP2097]|nr:hypothetical protein M885DRAFT_520415 [Pelagophyceae sp. CCMP2097]
MYMPLSRGSRICGVGCLHLRRTPPGARRGAPTAPFFRFPPWAASWRRTCALDKSSSCCFRRCTSRFSKTWSAKPSALAGATAVTFEASRFSRRFRKRSTSARAESRPESASSRSSCIAARSASTLVGTPAGGGRGSRGVSGGCGTSAVCDAASLRGAERSDAASLFAMSKCVFVMLPMRSCSETLSASTAERAASASRSRCDNCACSEATSRPFSARRSASARRSPSSARSCAAFAAAAAARFSASTRALPAVFALESAAARASASSAAAAVCRVCSPFSAASVARAFFRDASCAARSSASASPAASRAAVNRRTSAARPPCAPPCRSRSCALSASFSSAKRCSTSSVSMCFRRSSSLSDCIGP